ncbi:MAG: 30S ribosomal protein S13 [Alphaproteobacteria bacterium]|nr:30S ribosomal protein S13 [Alphaproteobacteria bacterium]
MVRLLGRNLANKKKIYIALTAIYGIGISRAQRILNEIKINPDKKVSDLSEDDISKIREALETEQFKLEGDLKRLISLNIKRLIDINSRRGRRHLNGLPVRGQRTRTNNRTSRRQNIFIRKK